MLVRGLEESKVSGTYFMKNIHRQCVDVVRAAPMIGATQSVTAAARAKSAVYAGQVSRGLNSYP